MQPAMVDSSPPRVKFLRPGRMVFWVSILPMAGYAFLIEPAWVEVTHHSIGADPIEGRMRVA